MIGERKSNGEKVKDAGILVILFAIISATYLLLYLPNNHQPKILSDEIGNLASAAFFAGYDWSKSLIYTDYYSFGYGAILSFLFRLDLKPLDIYRAMLAVNFVAASAVIFPAFGILRKLVPEMPRRWMYVTAFVISLYPPAVSLSHFAIGESFLFLLFFLAFYLVCRLSSVQFQPFTSILLAVVLLLSLALHIRSISLIAGVVFAMFCLLLRKETDRRNVAVFGVTLILGFIGFYVLQQFIVNHLWGASMESGRENVNGLSYRLDQLRRVFQYFDNVLTTISGHLIYIMFSTIGVGLIGLFAAIRSAFSWKNSLFTEQERTHRSVSGGLVLTYVLLLGMSVVSLSVNEIFPERLDRIFYGRYQDPAISVLLLLGIVWLYQNLWHRLRVIIPLGVAVAATLIYASYRITPILVDTFFQPVTVTGAYFFLAIVNGVTSRENITMQLLPWLIVTMILCVIFYVLSRFRKHIVVILILAGLFLLNSSLFAFYGVNGYNGQDAGLSENVAAFLRESDQTIYCVKNNDNDKYELYVANLLQFYDYKETFVIVKPTQLGDLSIGDCLLSRQFFNHAPYRMIQTVDQNQGLYLYNITSDSANNREEIVIDLSYFCPELWKSPDEEYTFSAEEYVPVVEGPVWRLEAGEYEVNLTLSDIDSDEVSLATVTLDALHQEVVQYSSGISLTGEQTVTLSIEFTLQEATNIRLRISAAAIDHATLESLVISRDVDLPD